MKEFPHLAPVDGDESTFEGGHLWIAELIEGDPLRFRMTDAGYLEFGDDELEFAHEASPLRYRHAIRAVREGFAQDTFRATVDDPGAITFFGVAVRHCGIEYEWGRTPSFLGTDVYDAGRGRYLPPDVVQQVFDRVGLVPLPPIEKEVRATDVDPDTYAIPDSQWYDGASAGVVFRNKAGGRAVRRRSPEPDRSPVRDDSQSVEELLESHVTDGWLAGVVDEAGAHDGSVTVDGLVERTLELLARETRALTGSDPLRPADVRPALAKRIDRYLGNREDGDADVVQ